MPAKSASPWLEHACVWAGKDGSCPVRAMVAIHAAHGQFIATCFNHAPLIFNWARATAGSEGGCVACGAQSANTYLVDAGDYDGRMCRGHAIAFIARALSPSAFDRLVVDAGGNPEAVFLLHGDFYGAGRARQPYPVGQEFVIAALRAMDELPDGDAAWAIDDPLIQATQRGFRDIAGIDLDPAVAAAMLERLIKAQGLQRELGETPLDPPPLGAKPERRSRRRNPGPGQWN